MLLKGIRPKEHSGIAQVKAFDFFPLHRHIRSRNNIIYYNSFLGARQQSDKRRIQR
jgi:hypothetical protein